MNKKWVTVLYDHTANFRSKFTRSLAVQLYPELIVNRKTEVTEPEVKLRRVRVPRTKIYKSTTCRGCELVDRTYFWHTSSAGNQV